jgi:hypothetical protein
VPQRPYEKRKEKPLIGVIRAVAIAPSPCACYDIEVLIRPSSSDMSTAVFSSIPEGCLQPAVSRDFDSAKDTQKAEFLESLGERVGHDPRGDQWKLEVPALFLQSSVRRGVLSSVSDPKFENAPVWTRSFEGLCDEHTQYISHFLKYSKTPRSSACLARIWTSCRRQLRLPRLVLLV